MAKGKQDRAIRRVKCKRCYVCDRPIRPGDEIFAAPGLYICPNCTIGLVIWGMEHV